MTSEQKTSKAIVILLWIAQGILCVSLVWAATMKLLQPADKLAAMWPWTADHPVLVKVTGVIDLLAGMGLILPALLGIQPRSITYTAMGVIALMMAAAIFHIARGETAQIGVNVFCAIIAGFIVWGRRK
jgi:hypothetical protein